MVQKILILILISLSLSVSAENPMNLNVVPPDHWSFTFFDAKLKRILNPQKQSRFRGLGVFKQEGGHLNAFLASYQEKAIWSLDQFESVMDKELKKSYKTSIILHKGFLGKPSLGGHKYLQVQISEFGQTAYIIYSYSNFRGQPLITAIRLPYRPTKEDMTSMSQLIRNVSFSELKPPEDSSK